MYMKQSKKLLCLLLALAVAVSCMALAGCGEVKKGTKSIGGANATTRSTTLTSEVATNDSVSPSGQTNIDRSDRKYIAIDVKDYGMITVALYPKVAPITVENILNLVSSGFYDGLTFHRIMEGFMIQGGDPKANGSGGSGKDIKGEFSSNGVKNDLSHLRGVISMARATPPDSASSQFFIVQKDSTFLDGNYAAFGEVTAGMDVVDAIVDDAKPTDSNGSIAKDKQPVINSIKVVG